MGGGGVIALGVDVATKAGWVVLEKFAGERVLETGIVGPGVGLPAWEQLERVVQNAHTKGARLAVLERPYLDKNPKVLEVLARLLGSWEQVCRARGLEVVLVRASEWQMGCLAGLISITSRRDARKKAAQVWCRAVYQLELDPDRADAVAMTTWVVKNRGLIERGKAAGIA